MSDLVIDASVVASWFVPGQATPSATAFLRDCPRHNLWAPHIFPTEIRNLLLGAERRGRTTPAATLVALRALDILDISVTPLGAPDDWDAVLELARNEGLTTYDALYLNLAIAGGLGLATRDAELIEAGYRRNIAVFDLRT
ncbi:MAG: hypothetical protein JWP35_774 [Caulobacter sp.]|nr:hypothetical protein [Caulobacter sp.]